MGRPLVVITVLVTLVALVTIGQSDALFQGEPFQLLTADDQLRIARVLDLVQGRNDWFDNGLHWSNTPFGTSLHWTRPLDAVVILLGAPFALFVGWKEGIRIGGYVSAPVLYAALLGTVWWVTRRLADSRVASLAISIVALQPVVLAYGAVGRVDHHIALLTIFAVMFGVAIVPTDHRSDRMAMVAGLVGALGIWISPEAIFAIALLGTTWVITWLVDGSKAGALLVFAASWGGGLLTASLLEHGPSNIAVLEYDRLSRPHLALGLAATMGAIVIVVMERVARVRRRPMHLHQRCTTLVGAVLVVIVVLGISRLEPMDLVRAPYSTVPDDIRIQWLEQLEEFRSIAQLPASAIVAYTAIPMIALVTALRHVIEWRSNTKHSSTWTIVTFWHIAALAVGLVNVRSLIYAEVSGAIIVAVAVGTWLERRRATQTKSLVEPLSLVMSALGSYVLAGAISILTPATKESSDGGCDSWPVVDELARRYVSQEPATGRPTGVLTQLDLGVFLHLEAGVDVVATGHHRNVEGIRSVRSIFRSSAEVGRQELNQRGIRYIVVCEGIGTEFMTPMPENSLYTDLVSGPPPIWLTEIPTGGSGMRLFEVTTG